MNLKQKQESCRSQKKIHQIEPAWTTLCDQRLKLCDSTIFNYQLHGHVHSLITLQVLHTASNSTWVQPPHSWRLMSLIVVFTVLSVTGWKYAHFTHSHVCRLPLKAGMVQLQHPQLCIRICKCHSTWTRRAGAHTLRTLTLFQTLQTAA